ncbi:hypothetical protein BDY19DRAFT_663872 [Irpex rosettiformis]|uniref:Uncharacterized protein n=1 Tax=Irpex rosettiformis TaxID=378272 RepID=A0ACB8U9H0_9APHY|nr:hypothetical protein BDY19DRAFT_663872 [Irpex rosettiformis]
MRWHCSSLRSKKTRAALSIGPNMDQSSPINHVCDTSMDDVYAKEAHNTAGFWIGFIPPLEFIKMYIPSSCALKVTPSKEVRGRIVIKSCCQEGYQHNSQARVAFMQKCGGKISASVIRSYMELKDGCPKTAVESHPLQEVDDTREDAQVQDDGEHIQTSASGEVAIPLPPGSERIPTRTDLDPGLFVEIATHGDPFHDDPKDAQQWGTIEKREYQSMLTRGKLAWQAKQTFNRQHRTHVFQLLVFGDEARFVRWDRAGASVSGKFNYVEHPSQPGRKHIRQSFDLLVSFDVPDRPSGCHGRERLLGPKLADVQGGYWLHTNPSHGGCAHLQETVS